jgi:hypothetical protein
MIVKLAVPAGGECLAHRVDRLLEVARRPGTLLIWLQELGVIAPEREEHLSQSENTRRQRWGG